MALFFLSSCQKENLHSDASQSLKLKVKAATNKLDAFASTAPGTCGTPTTVNLVDNYPNQYYLTYGTLVVSNDANNVYITLNSLSQYNFSFTKIQLTIGDLAHLTSMVPYFDYPLGPPTSDYVQNFTIPVTTYTFTIPRSSISASCFNVYIWAREATPNNSDFKFVWAQSTTTVTANQDSQYINYCLQACTGGKGGDGDDHGKGKDKDDDHDKGDKGHDKGDHDKGDKDHDHGDNDKDHGHDDKN
jgi:hypothetical protein